MRKTLGLVRLGTGELMVISNYTGEIAYPWEFGVIFRMICDMIRY